MIKVRSGSVRTDNTDINEKAPKRGLFQMEFDFIPSSKRGLNEDELPKSAGSSSKRGLNEDELPKSAGSSSKRGLNEDESRIISFIGAIFGKFVSLYIQKPFFY